MANEKKILAVDDEPDFLSFLCMRLEVSGYSVITAKDGEEALNKARENKPDLIILDLMLPKISGPDVLQRLRKKGQKAPVLVLTAYPEAQFAVRSFKLGASGYLTKQSVSDELVTAIQRILAGGKYVTASLAERLASRLGDTGGQAPHEALSNRELQVLHLIAVGKSMKDVADELALSEKTVATYRARISEKAGLKTSVEIARYALKQGLVE